MGCDIHICPERLEFGKWIPAEPFVLSEWWYDNIIDEDKEFKELDYDDIKLHFDEMTHNEIISKYGDDLRVVWDGPWDTDYDLRSRNYDWFSVLANVRNGFYEDRREFEPIDEPRGLPNDVSVETQRQSEHWGIDGHSHSWLTLQELLKVDWDGQIARKRGMVDSTEFKKLQKIGQPSSWCGAVYGPNIKIISNEEMKQIVVGCYGILDPNSFYYTGVEWSVSYREAVGSSYLQNILDKLAEYGKPDEVRIIFWFDN